MGGVNRWALSLPPSRRELTLSQRALANIHSQLQGLERAVPPVPFCTGLQARELPCTPTPGRGRGRGPGAVSGLRKGGSPVVGGARLRERPRAVGGAPGRAGRAGAGPGCMGGVLGRGRSRRCGRGPGRGTRAEGRGLVWWAEPGEFLE